MTRTLQTSSAYFSRVSYLFECNANGTYVLRMTHFGIIMFIFVISIVIVNNYNIISTIVISIVIVNNYNIINAIINNVNSQV